VAVKPRPELVLAGITVLWGSTFVVTKDVVRELAPLPFLCVRFGLGAIVLLGLYGKQLAAAGDRRRLVRDGVVLGLLNSCGLVLQVFGQAYTTASKSAFVTSLNTPLTPVFGFLLYRMRPSLPQRVAVCLATVGVMALTWPGAGARYNPGDLITVAAAAMYALVIVEMSRRGPRHQALPLTVVQVSAAAALFFVLLLVSRATLATVPLARLPEMLRLEARPFSVSPRGALELAYMGLVCTVVTFAGQTWAMARLSATHAAVIFALEPVFATVMALCVDGAAEWPGAGGAAGAALILVAVLVSEIRLARRAQP
jgi:drug/metabolite transporter (DMT)-like permease